LSQSGVNGVAVLYQNSIGSMEIQNSLFEEIKGMAFGGGIYIRLITGNTTINNNIFKKCSSTFFGGALYYSNIASFFNLTSN
jgi:hypothetical protein